jgi:ABC-type amino acid transport system permease subunit
MNTARLGVQFDIGNYIHVIFAGKFVLLWLFFILYPHYFDFSAFFSLVVCTAVYAAFVAASVRAGRRAAPSAQPATDQQPAHER